MVIQRHGYHEVRNIGVKYLDGYVSAGSDIGGYHDQVIIFSIGKARARFKPFPFNVETGILT